MKTHPLICRLVLVGIVLLPSICSAQVYINEIMYDLAGTDTSREWVEIYNSGSSPVTVVPGGANAAWRFSDGSQHSLTLVSGSNTLSAGGYAVIADNSSVFMTDWPSFSGTLYDSSFTLNNTGSTVSVLSTKDGQVLDQVTYASSQGANGDGNSLQKSGANWIVAAPTPGAANAATAIAQNNSTSTATTTDSQTATSTSTTTSQTNSDTSSHVSYVSLYEYVTTDPLKISAGRNRMSVVGVPIEFEAEANVYDHNISYIWTFGDGTTGQGKIATHTYDYPGDYVVVVNAGSPQGPAVSRTQVTVTEPKLSIVEAGPAFIKIKNNSTNEVNLYGWKLSSKEKKFDFPPDTIIKSGSVVTFSSNVTGLNPTGALEVSLGTSAYKVQDGSNKNEMPTSTPNPTSEISSDLSDLYTKASKIQKQLAIAAKPKKELPKKETTKAVAKSAPKANQNVANVIATTRSTSTNTKQSGTSWLGTIKKFFFGTKK